LDKLTAERQEREKVERQRREEQMDREQYKGEYSVRAYEESGRWEPRARHARSVPGEPEPGWASAASENDS
jgi:hypothetical protein